MPSGQATIPEPAPADTGKQTCEAADAYPEPGITEGYISIPIKSYTAFKLRYCDAFELSQTSSILSLGTIPLPWIIDRKSWHLTKQGFKKAPQPSAGYTGRLSDSEESVADESDDQQEDDGEESDADSVPYNWMENEELSEFGVSRDPVRPLRAMSSLNMTKSRSNGSFTNNPVTRMRTMSLRPLSSRSQVVSVNSFSTPGAQQKLPRRDSLVEAHNALSGLGAATRGANGISAPTAIPVAHAKEEKIVFNTSPLPPPMPPPNVKKESVYAPSLSPVASEMSPNCSTDMVSMDRSIDSELIKIATPLKPLKPLMHPTAVQVRDPTEDTEDHGDPKDPEDICTPTGATPPECVDADANEPANFKESAIVSTSELSSGAEGSTLTPKPKPKPSDASASASAPASSYAPASASASASAPPASSTPETPPEKSFLTKAAEGIGSAYGFAEFGADKLKDSYAAQKIQLDAIEEKAAKMKKERENKKLPDKTDGDSSQKHFSRENSLQVDDDKEEVWSDASEEQGSEIDPVFEVSKIVIPAEADKIVTPASQAEIRSSEKSYVITFDMQKVFDNVDRAHREAWMKLEEEKEERHPVSRQVNNEPIMERADSVESEIDDWNPEQQKKDSIAETVDTALTFDASLKALEVVKNSSRLGVSAPQSEMSSLRSWNGATGNLAHIEPRPVTMKPPSAKAVPVRLLQQKHARADKEYKMWISETITGRLANAREKRRTSERARFKQLFKVFGAGTPIRAERMLVEMKAGESDSHHNLYSEKVTDKWRDYVIIVKSTGDVLNPVILYFHKVGRSGPKVPITANNLDAIDEAYKGSSYEFTMTLSSETCEVQSVSDEDKSFRLVQKMRDDYVVAVMLAQTTSSAVRWIAFLRALLEEGSSSLGRTLALTIPDLDVSMVFSNLDFRLDTPEEQEPFRKGTFEVRYHSKGYEMPRIKKIDYLLDLILQKARSLQITGKLPETNNAHRMMHKLIHDRNFLAMAFRSYDKMEWIVGEKEIAVCSMWSLISDSLSIELRELSHDTHIVHSPETGLDYLEPQPVEGFLLRLSGRTGKIYSTIGRGYFRLEYFYTSGPLLMFQRHYTAVPPFEGNISDVMSPSGDVFSETELESRISGRRAMFEKNPYKRQGSHIAWLKPGITRRQFRAHDNAALYEAERRACLSANTQSVLDLREAKAIYAIPANKLSIAVKSASALTWGHQRDEMRSKDTEYQDTAFEILLMDGSRLRLEASSKTVRDAWVKQLSDISAWFTERHKQDLYRQVSLRKANIQRSNICREAAESSVVEGSQKWELAKAVTDPALYTISSHAMNKPVLMYGSMYVKEDRNDTFTQVYGILSPGFLLLFKMFERNKITGKAKPTAFYEHWVTLGLSDCFLYDDPANDLDLIFRRGGSYNKLSPGDTSLPRVYQDGWRSSEDQRMRYFTVWYGQGKRSPESVRAEKTFMGDRNDLMVSKDSDPEARRNHDQKEKYLSSQTIRHGLSVSSDHLTFLVRSRQIRDVWSLQIRSEIERLAVVAE